MISLQRLLRDADERVRQACADAINKASKELESEIQANMSDKGIKSDTGQLRGSVKATQATPQKPVSIVKSQVYAKMPKNPNRNRRLWGKSDLRYSGRGVPYGRVLEFSPRYSKYNGFFWSVWYKHRQQIREDVIKAIGEAWSNG